MILLYRRVGVSGPSPRTISDVNVTCLRMDATAISGSEQIMASAYRIYKKCTRLSQ